MRGSSLTTFLMFLPLIAIPLLAIFGVPEFTPVNASTPTETNAAAIAIDGPVRKLEPAGAPKRSAFNRNGDVFSPVKPDSNAAPGFPSGGLKPEADPFLNAGGDNDTPRKPGKQGLNGWELDRDRHDGKRSRNRIETSILDERNNSSAGATRGAGMQSVPSMPETNEPAVAWQKAVRTLNRMGIEDFLLQPGSRAEEFHFSCICPSPDNPRITRRFEAEDADPLRAVQKVLKQIQTRQ
jgi:hypothetical protein